MNNIYLMGTLIITSAGILFAGSPLTDPLIPDHETIVYSIQRGEDVSTLTQTVELKKSEGQDRYLIDVASDKQDMQLEMICEGLLPLKNERIQKDGRADFVIYSEIRSIPLLNEDEILIVDFNDLSHVLRGYPFDDPETLEVVFPYQADSDEKKKMTFHIKYINKEKLKLENGFYEAYKLQLAAQISGGMSVFSGLVPKTYFWYSQEAPHFLLKYEGGSGAGGSDEIIMEMIHYSVLK